MTNMMVKEKVVLGIIGGGQLGMMLTETAKSNPLLSDRISKVVVLDPTKDCPAAQAGAEQIVADFKDRDAIVNLADVSDIITYEIESGNSHMLKSLEARVQINPSPETLRIIQDKLLQKEFLSRHGLPVADFARIGQDDRPNKDQDILSMLKESLQEFGYPSLLKARRDAYDGRGNFKLESEVDLPKALDYFAERRLMLERFVPFRMEVSVIASRNTSGQIKTYPLVENIHYDNILRETIAPARVEQDVAQKAQDIANKTMAVLGGAGVFGIEMFVTRDDQIVINEIAPRVHNSGHHTLQSSQTSQFEQHLRAILDMDLGSTQLMRPTIMYNILGSKLFEGRYAPLSLDGEQNVFLKMYGKQISKPLRKLGHLNLVASHAQESIDSLIERLERIKGMVKVTKIQ